MRVLWFTNLPIGEAPSLLGSERSVFGGWLEGLLSQMASVEDVQLAVAFPSDASSRVSRTVAKEVEYYSFQSGPSGSESGLQAANRLLSILEQAHPDVVHVFGTELQHTVTVMRHCRDIGIPTVLQMQGLMGSIAQHYMGWLPSRVTKQWTPVELVRHRTLQQLVARFQRAAELESEALRLATHVLGHTTYDRAWAKQTNANACYHAADETLRGAFYNGEWSPDDCDRHTLLISQAVAPYKGAHIAIEAMPVILQSFPDTRLFIAGPDPVGGRSLVNLAKRSTYGWYLKNLVHRLDLAERVRFVGPLDEISMRNRYLKSHVFLSCSSIENESNSVSEAKILGLPVVASYVGGVPDRVEHGDTGFLYQGDAPYMLAHYVMEILADDELASRMGTAARRDALRRHDRKRNVNRIVEIYRTVLDHERTGSVK